MANSFDLLTPKIKAEDDTSDETEEKVEEVEDFSGRQPRGNSVLSVSWNSKMDTLMIFAILWLVSRGMLEILLETQIPMSTMPESRDCHQELAVNKKELIMMLKICGGNRGP